MLSGTPMAFRLLGAYKQNRVSFVFYNYLCIFSPFHWSGLYSSSFRIPENSFLYRHLLAWDSLIHDHRSGRCGTYPADFTFPEYVPANCEEVMPGNIWAYVQDSLKLRWNGTVYDLLSIVITADTAGYKETGIKEIRKAISEGLLGCGLR